MSKWDDPDVRAIATGTGTNEEKARLLRERNPGVDFTSEAVRLWIRRNSEIKSSKWTDTKQHLDSLYKQFFGIKKVFLASDFEFPYADKEFCNKAIQHAIDQNCTLAILCGDILHMASYSPYGNDHSVSFQLEELGPAVDMISEMRRYMDVLLLSGNHERRLQRVVKKSMNLGEVDLMVGDSLDPLAYLAKASGSTNAGWWYVQINDMIVAHPDRYASGGIKNIVNSINYFIPRIEKPWNVLAQGHSHQLNHGSVNGKYYLELGCMSDIIDYNVGPKQTQPIWQQGYAIAEFQDGIYQPNQSNIYYGRKLL